MAVAGSFYPSSPDDLKRTMDACFERSSQPPPLAAPVAVICPHAGYVYSGAAAASAYRAVAESSSPDIVVILGPNHTGMGAPVSVAAHSHWETVGGQVPVAREASELAECLEIARLDTAAHLTEHSIEVQIPFLMRVLPKGFEILPVAMCLPPNHTGIEACSKLAHALVELLSGKKLLIVASTDMSHYLSDAEARRRDRPAIRAVEAFDPALLVQTVAKEQITMCGVMPTAAALIAARGLGATSCTLVDYRTSGEASGDWSHVVSYAAFVAS